MNDVWKRYCVLSVEWFAVGRVLWLNYIINLIWNIFVRKLHCLFNLFNSGNSKDAPHLKYSYGRISNEKLPECERKFAKPRDKLTFRIYWMLRHTLDAWQRSLLSIWKNFIQRLVQPMVCISSFNTSFSSLCILRPECVRHCATCLTILLNALLSFWCIHISSDNSFPSRQNVF